MSVTKTFTVSPTFRKATNRSLVKHLPSDLLYSFGAALYDKANKQTTRARQDFYRKTCERILSVVKNIKNLEEQYYATTK